MQMKAVSEFLQIIPATQRFDVGFFEEWFIQIATQKAGWKSLIHDLKDINLKLHVIFCFGAKNAQNQVFVDITMC